MKKKINILLLSIAIIMTTMPFYMLTANAATDTTILEINEGLEYSNVVSFDATKNKSGTGWTWDASTNLLTLTNFQGHYINATGDINILLNGDNTIELEPEGTYGITATGNVVINDNKANEDGNYLSIYCGSVECGECTYGIKAGEEQSNKTITMNGGSTSVYLSKNESESIPMYGLYSKCTYVEGDANLDVYLLTEDSSYGVFGSLYTTTSGDIEITSDSETSDGSAITGTFTDCGTGSVAIDYAEECNAINGGLVVMENAGNITISGSVKFASYSQTYFAIDNHKQILYPDNYIITRVNNGYEENALYLTDEYGDPITYLEIDEAQGNNGLSEFKVVNTPLYEISQGKLVLNQKYEGPDIFEMAQGGTAPYAFSCNDLPQGLAINSTTGKITGTPTQVFSSGIATINVRDSNNRQETIYLNYSQPVESDSSITIDGNCFNCAMENYGNGWTYNGEHTLCLNNYSGGPIICDGQLSIELSGNNTITMDTEDDCGIYANGGLNIRSNGYEDPSITVNGTNLTNANQKYYGIKSSDFVNLSSNCTINLKGLSTNDNAVCAIKCEDVIVDDNANLTIDVKDCNNAIGIDSPCSFNQAGQVDISMTPTGSCDMDKAIAINNTVTFDDTFDISISSPNYLAVHGKTMSVSNNAGNINIIGAICVSEKISLGSSKVIASPEDYLLCQDDTTYPAIPKEYENDASSPEYSFVLMKADGTLANDVLIKSVDSNPLTLVDTSLFDVPSVEDLKSDNSIYASPYFTDFIHGGTAPYQLEITRLPNDNSISYEYENGYLKIKCNPVEKRDGGNAVMTVTDANNDTKSINIHYGAVGDGTDPGVDNGPISIKFMHEYDVYSMLPGDNEYTQSVVDQNGDIYAGVYFESSDEDIVKVLEKDALGNVKIKIVGPGKTTVTAHQIGGELTATYTVYVRESKPNAELTGSKLTGLEPNTKYLINEHIYTANENGQIQVDAYLAGKNAYISTYSEDELLRSEEQVVSLMDIIDISTLSDHITVDNCSYDGQAKVPDVRVYSEGTLLTNGVDYKLECSNNIQVGDSATVNIIGIGNYIGSVNKTFSIERTDINTLTATLSCYTYKYTSDGVYEPTVSINGLQKGVDFTVSYEDNENVGDATVIITGIGNYTGENEIAFEICNQDIADGSLAFVNGKTYTYTGDEIIPSVTVTYNNEPLTESVDYTIELENNINAGTAKITIDGINGFGGKIVDTFTIKPIDITDLEVYLNDENLVYSGNAITPDVTIGGLEEDTDYIVEYKNNINATTMQSKAEAKITGMGNYSGTSTHEFDISARNIANIDFDLSCDEYTYDKTAKTPVVTTTEDLRYNIDYSVDYANNINEGEGTVTITGNGNYQGSIMLYFTIEAANISDLEATLSQTLYTYDGTQKTPEVYIEGLTAETDFDVSFSDNVDAGTGTVTVAGLNNYYGEIELDFTIEQADISNMSATLSEDTFVYNGTEHTPSVTIPGLIVDQDYIVSHSNNINSGKATADITGMGNYKGEIHLTFDISKANIESLQTRLSNTQYSYDGKAHEPYVTIGNLKENNDYRVEYKDNIQQGEATATIIGVGNYEGTIVLHFTITKTDISDLDISMSRSSYTYDGTYKEPEVYIYGLKLDKDYTVSYINNKEIGRGMVAVTGIGNYTGSMKLSFKITAPTILATSGAYAKLSTYKSINVSWNKVKFATGYEVSYRKSTSKAYSTPKNITSNKYSLTGLSSGYKYYVKITPYLLSDNIKYYGASKYVSTTTLKKVSAPVVSKYSKTKVKVKWTNISGESGYQISKSTSSKSTKIVLTRSTVSGTYNTLSVTKNKTYYYKVRAYSVVNGVRVYAPWSSTKAYKLK